MLRILIPGGTGALGTLLARHFYQRGAAVTLLGRYPRPREWTTVHWEPPAVGPWTDVLEEADVVINLAGGSLNSRHTRSQRRAILKARLDTTASLGEAIARCGQPPKLWINLGSLPTGTFGHDASVRWEEQFHGIETPYTRKLAVRAAWVMSTEPGGVFTWLLRLVRYGLVGSFGEGQQLVSWIHEHDFVAAVESLIGNAHLAPETIDLCAPLPLSNAEFMATLRRAWNPYKLGFAMPAWVLQALSLDWLLESARCQPWNGREFVFPDWQSAAADLIDRYNSPAK